MCKDHSVASILLPCSIGLGFGTILGCYFWADANGHLTHDHLGDTPRHYPFVSQMGDHAPEHYLFAAGFAVSAILLALATGIRFVQFRWAMDWVDPERAYGYTRACNIVLLVVNVFAAGNLVVLSSFGLSEYKIAHFVGAGLFFVSTAIYQIFHTAFTAYVSRLVTRNKLVTPNILFQPATDNMLVWYLVWNIIMFLAMVMAVALYVPVGVWATAIMQHVLIFAVLMYYLPWFYELKTAYVDSVLHAQDDFDT